MKSLVESAALLVALVAILLGPSPVSSFRPLSSPVARRPTFLSMVLEKPKAKQLSKLEELKISSGHLVHPLKEVRFVSVELPFTVPSRPCLSAPKS